MRQLSCILAYALTIGAGRSAAQSSSATIPIVVAQALSVDPGFLGRPQFFDARTPPGWPAALVPTGAKILGGGIIGDSAFYRLRATVFEVSAGVEPRTTFDRLVTRAGYARRSPDSAQPRSGGFAGTAEPAPARYCKGSTLVTFGPVDSARSPSAYALFLLDGEGGRQSCRARGVDPSFGQFPVTVPPLYAPKGVASFGGGRGWSGSTGEMRLTLRTTMPTDSILAHYSAQLVAGGWKAEGQPANTDGVGLQRFSFKDGQDAWTGALIVVIAGDLREVRLELVKKE